MKKVLLYSGGLDSWLIDKLWNPDLKLYIDIEGRYSKEEIKRLPGDVKVIKFPLGEYEQPSAFIPMRNLYFLMLGSNYGNNICLGATEGDKGSKDKTEEFLIKAEEMMNYLSGKQSKVLEDRKIVVCKEFIHKYKNDLIEEYLKVGGNIEKAATETFSCHFPDNEEECFSCKPCFRKFCLMEYYGYKYSQERRIKMFRYIREKIVPRSKNIDGTITDDKNSKGYPFTGEVRKEAIQGIEKLKENGCKLILWTARYGWCYQEALAICEHYQIKFDAYNHELDKRKKSQKIYADFYIDDKSCIGEIDWEKTVEHILKLKNKKEI